LTTDAASGASAASSFVTNSVRQSTAQLVGAFSQTTKMSYGTLAAVAKALAKVPPSMPAIPLAPSKETLKEWLNVSFDTTEQLLKLQRELMVEMLDRLAAFGKRG
jgi:hypothetical protein